MTRQRIQFGFAVVLLLWQLMAGGLTHAAPMTSMDCMHDQASHGQASNGQTSHEQAEQGQGPPADHGDGCGSSVCQCPCGHTPALRVDLLPPGTIAPPAACPAKVVESLHADPIEEHFRPPT